ncbi:MULTISPECIES: helix-turn-helix domain-containing protein [Bacillus cereus group]|uniref:MarR family transcriptional regulator n=1 Tax=Bacillus cereus group TaxID=86661 RepID=UPI002DFD0AC8|nr:MULTISPECIES: helix-turn-helix domain-containing protein [Bacillus cereus group]MCU5556827.1 MarR family transcriptional regulator [Bacillus cereus]MEC5241236.1 helix-turn-helix domain-containing protein [Bacillus mycoides]MED0993837.1 helix-turn-helix domain-containing protein [Bacillus nitratireducens]MCU5691701.1 MarR family transcriptional regulator [Bacillus cereus]MEC5267231.1 helix-turn-helix domain-containing protein [Bacillus mycoides]
MTKVVDFGQAEKKAKIRDSKIDSIYDQLQTGGYSEEERAMLLQMLSKMSGGEEYFIGKKKKPTDRVRFVQIIMDNIDYLIEIGYLSSKEEAFLFKLTSSVEFKTNVLVERETNNPASPTYLAEKFKMTRQSISSVMNGLLKKGVLAVAQSGVTTEDGRVCTSRTWFVNPNVMCCSPKDGIDKATQHIFRDSLRNFKIEDQGKKKHKLPIYLF